MLGVTIFVLFVVRYSKLIMLRTPEHILRGAQVSGGLNDSHKPGNRQKVLN